MKSVVIALCAIFLLCACVTAPPGLPDRTETIEETDLTLMRFETFEEDPLSVQITHFSDKGGDGIASTSATTSLTMDADSRRLLFTTDTGLGFSTPCEAGPDDWFNYYLTIDTQRPPAGFDGVALDLKARNFNYLELVVKEERKDGLFLARAPVFLNENEWRQLRIPFSGFVPDEEGEAMEMRHPIILEITIPYDQNLYLGHFLRDGEEPELLVDNLAFFRRKEAAAAGMPVTIEDFEDTIADISFYGELAEAVFYVDYTESDSGECRMTPGVESHALTMTRVQKQDNAFFRIQGDVSLTPDFARHLEKDRSFYLFLRAQTHMIPVEWQGFQFSVRSDVVRECQVDFIDAYSGAYYTAGFHLSPAWTQVRLPLNRLMGEEGTLADAELDRSWFTIIFSGEIPPEAVHRSLESGRFAFNLDLDNIGYF